MSGNSFKSVFMVAICAGSALACYLVSLHVASERAALEQVETEIVLAERDIRLLQTEIGTRGRLAQLERWNVKVLALSAPAAEQFVGNGFELARMVAPKRRVDLEAPVVLASAPLDPPKPQVPDPGASAADEAPKLLHTASLERALPARSEATVKPAAATGRGERKAVAASRGMAAEKSVDKPGQSAPKPVTKSVKVAKPDPLAPLPKSGSAKSTSRTDVPRASATKPAKDSPTKP